MSTILSIAESAIFRCPVELWTVIFQHVAHVPKISPVENLVGDIWELSSDIEHAITKDYERRSRKARRDLLSLLLVCRAWVDPVYEVHLANVSTHGTYADLRALMGLLRQPRYNGYPDALKGGLVKTFEVGRTNSTYVHRNFLTTQATEHEDLGALWQIGISDVLILCTDLRNFIFNLDTQSCALYGGRVLANIIPNASATLESVSRRYRTGMLDMSIDDMNSLLQARPRLLHLTWQLPGIHKKLTAPPPVSNLQSLDLSSFINGSRTWFGIFARMELPNLQDVRLNLFGQSSITSHRQRVRGPLLDFFNAHGPRLRMLEVWAHLESGNVGFTLFDLCPSLREFSIVGRFMTATIPHKPHPWLKIVRMSGTAVFAENGNLERGLEVCTGLWSCGPAIEVVQLYDNLTLDFASNWCYKVFRRRCAELLALMKAIRPSIQLQDCFGEPIEEEFQPAWEVLPNGVRIGGRFEYTY